MSNDNTRLRGRWFLLARAGWIVLAILTLAIFFASLPVYIALLQPNVRGVKGDLPNAHRA